MKFLAVVLFVVAALSARAQELPRLLVIDKCTAQAPLGEKATLTVSPLKRRNDRFVGSYTVVLSPLPVANEAGALEVVLPADALRNLATQRPIAFIGTATNDAGKPRTIQGTATPRDARQGAIQLDITSERGKLRYHASYRLP